MVAERSGAGSETWWRSGVWVWNMIAERGLGHGSGAGRSGVSNMVAERCLEHGGGAERSVAWDMAAERGLGLEHGSGAESGYGTW